MLTVGARAGKKDRTLEVYFIDSEGGGSTLIVTPNDESVLIDAGHLGARDAGWIVTAAKAAGLTKIDYLVLTHYHSDHFGAASEIVLAHSPLLADAEGFEADLARAVGASELLLGPPDAPSTLAIVSRLMEVAAAK